MDDFEVEENASTLSFGKGFILMNNKSVDINLFFTP